MKIGVVGAAGRMGKNHIAEILETEGAQLGAALERVDSPFVGKDTGAIAGTESTGIKITDSLEELVANCDAVIDFSSPESTLKVAEASAAKGSIHVVGTTGLTDAEESQLAEYAKKARIIYASNMSIGVNLLFALVEKVSATLDESYDIEVLEMHHNKKVDSPSGTALSLGKAAAEGRGVKLDDVWCKERDGQIGARPKGEIGFATLRGGDVVGDHTVMFATEGERIEITHKASSRKIYSKGAVKACLWAKDKPAGLYNMRDVLGI